MNVRTWQEREADRRASVGRKSREDPAGRLTTTVSSAGFDLVRPLLPSVERGQARWGLVSTHAVTPGHGLVDVVAVWRLVVSHGR